MNTKETLINAFKRLDTKVTIHDIEIPTDIFVEMLEEYLRDKTFDLKRNYIKYHKDL